MYLRNCTGQYSRRVCLCMCACVHFIYPGVALDESVLLHAQTRVCVNASLEHKPSMLLCACASFPKTPYSFAISKFKPTPKSITLYTPNVVFSSPIPRRAASVHPLPYSGTLER